MRVVFYCQHVLGVGHFFRSLEIVKGLADHEVVLVTGGAEVDFDPPANMTQVQLPGLMMSPDFKDFIPLEEGVTDVDDVLARRLVRFEEIMEQYRPDVFLVELFPFGRRKFRFELLPILHNIKEGRWGACKSVCSVRDILVEKSNPQKHVDRVLSMLNPNFDAVLVHADPLLVTLDETFPGVSEIEPELHYTGYVARPPESGAGPALREELGLGDMPLIVVSAGGGNVGSELVRAAIEASHLLAASRPHRLCVFSGPYASDEDFERYCQLAQGHDWITVKRFTTRFPAYLAAADLSVSLGGYNTTMNLLAAKTYGLLYPFMQNREQAMRTQRLDDRGMVSLLAESDLVPATLAERMAQGLDREPPSHGIDLNGGPKTARILEALIR